jgi:hypothetical protein
MGAIGSKAERSWPPAQATSNAPLVAATDEAGRRFAQRSVGLQAFLRPNPIERMSRDLATYLRQPGPDRALTDAAAGILAQPVGAQDLWR